MLVKRRQKCISLQVLNLKNETRDLVQRDRELGYQVQKSRMSDLNIPPPPNSPICILITSLNKQTYKQSTTKMLHSMYVWQTEGK